MSVKGGNYIDTHHPSLSGVLHERDGHRTFHTSQRESGE
jgi:hypothetical protein